MQLLLLSVHRASSDQERLWLAVQTLGLWALPLLPQPGSPAQADLEMQLGSKKWLVQFQLGDLQGRRLSGLSL